MTSGRRLEFTDLAVDANGVTLYAAYRDPRIGYPALAWVAAFTVLRPGPYS